MVILLIGIMGALASNQIDSILVWKQKQEIRQLAQTWNFLFHHSVGKGQAFRLVLDLDDNSYRVLREIPVSPSATLEVREVDLLSNLRTRREKERRKEAENEGLDEEEAQKLSESFRSGPLEDQFNSMLYSDPFTSVRLVPPEELKSLSEKHFLPESLEIREVQLAETSVEEGQTFIRLSPRGNSQFAVIRLVVEEVDFSVFLNPSTGEVEVKEGFQKYEWTFQKNA